MPKTMPKPSPEQAEKIISTFVAKSLDGALAAAKQLSKNLGLTAEEAAESFNKAVDAWAAKN